MYRKRQLLKKITSICTKFIRQFLANIKKQLIWLLRTVFRTQKQQQGANAGFVLPTVVMVSVVVVLLTTAIMFRSFDRAQTASNVRVNQMVMNAAAPAIDRARAKLNKLFTDKRLPRATPTEKVLDGVLATYISEYTFGDEKPLTINCIDPALGANGLNKGVCLDANSTAQTPLKTAWQFPVDTDNNGKFDSYILYGIYYKNPELNTANTQYKVKRNPLQARTTPMTFTSIGGNCPGNKVTSASLVGVNGWFKGNKSLRLVKGFFVYTTTVPITSTATIPSDSTKDKYEVNTSNKSFSALEYEQDKIQKSLINNAVVYQDDLSLTPGPDFKLNGQIFTNANFLTGPAGSNKVRIYQVSSPSSCFYEADNAKVTVGGNIATGGFTGGASGYTTFDLFPGKGVTPSQTLSLNNNQSVTDGTTDIAYNSLAYTQRVNRLVAAQIAAYPNNTDGTGKIQTSDPSEVQQGIQQQEAAIGLSIYTDTQVGQYRSEQLQLYFQKRTRRVPFKEVAFGVDGVGSYTSTSPLQGTDESLRPIDAWSYPTNPTDGKTGTGYTGLTLKSSGTAISPSATEPTLLLKNGKEQYFGDRVQVGNNLPQLWWKTTDPNNANYTPQFVGSDPSDIQSISNINWDSWDSSQPTTKSRYRLSRIQTLADVGSTDRDRDWELAAAKIPETPQDPVGGLRVVTGTGIYLPQGDTPATTDFTSNRIQVNILPVPLIAPFTTLAAPSITVWSDMMPVPNTINSGRGTITPYAAAYPELQNVKFTVGTPVANVPYLKMRATAVYHYKQTGYSQQSPTPIACVSSFYDPTSTATDNNQTGLSSWTAPTGFGGGGTGGLSNNGIVYTPPTKGVSDYQNLLTYQSTLKYANGRLIDDGLLAGALAKTASNRTLSQRSAIDAAICALQILDSSISPSSTVIPHGAIFETAFLDGRQVKAIHSDNTATTSADERFINIYPYINPTEPNLSYVDSGAIPSTNYDLPRQDRQPLEIRATVLDLGKLKGQTIGGTTPAQEYLVPNSGIIYATRDDALVDRTSTSTDITANKLESAVDYKLDPTRRPNAIVLVNGSELWRELNYRDAEKGLIVATNLPSYIKGDFNLHSGEEFITALDSTWSNFYTRNDPNPNFACRPNDPRLSINSVNQCPTGDKWRTAAVISDSMTLLSNNYRFGFRNEGDYDWNNNSSDPASITSRQFNTDFGINTNFQFNTYAPKAIGMESQYKNDATGFRVADLDSSISGNQGSSYLFNYVTPVVRQTQKKNVSDLYLDYVYEVCDTTRYTDCSISTTDPQHWAITNVTNNNYNGQGQNSWRNGGGAIEGQPVTSVKTGSVSNPPSNGWNNPLFKRRFAFKRDVTTGNLVSPLAVYGVDSSGKLQTFTVSTRNTIRKVTIPSTDTEMIPWLRLDSNGQWEPVLWNSPETSNENNSNWLQQSTTTTYNVIIASGDTPARTTEDNGGLHNYVRFSEIWSGTTANITGVFMQLKKSSYATAPFDTSLTSDDSSLNYATSNGNQKLPFYQPPTRLWGYDVGILSQSPDLLAQRLVAEVNDLPNEYFREVSRDDPWVQNLLCAKNDSNSSYVIDTNQRPSICQS